MDYGYLAPLNYLENWKLGNSLSNGSFTGSSASSSLNDVYLEKYKQTADDSWLEKWLDNQVSRENTSSAREWEEKMSNTAFSRLVDDIDRAGYNPWLALQNGFGQASSFNTSSASNSARSVSKENETERHNKSTESLRIITGILAALAFFL